MEIEKKTWPKYFKLIESGDKTFEVRLADQEYRKGDVLVLREWDPEAKQYTGRVMKKAITYVSLTKGQNFWPEEDVAEKGLAIIGFK